MEHVNAVINPGEGKRERERERERERVEGRGGERERGREGGTDRQTETEAGRKRGNFPFSQKFTLEREGKGKERVIMYIILNTIQSINLVMLLLNIMIWTVLVKQCLETIE